MLAKVAARERANRTESITDTNLPPRKAYLRLNSLVSQGDLEAIGEKKGRIYKIGRGYQGLRRFKISLRESRPVARGGELKKANH